MTQPTPAPEWFLAQYAIGALPPAGMALAECYLALNPGARAQAETVEAMAGWALETGPAVPVAGPPPTAPPMDGVRLPPAGSAKRPGPILAPVFADLLADLLADRPARVRWRWAGPGLHLHRLRALETGRVRARLLRIAPGRAMPRHTHEGLEATLVLRGAYRDGAARFGPGDLQLAGSETEHRPVALAGGTCICLAVSDAPLKLTGRISGVVSRAFSGGRA